MLDKWFYHLNLAISLGVLGTLSSLLSQQFFVFPTLDYLAYDYLAVTSLYVHHQYIGGLTTLGALVHHGIALGLHTSILIKAKGALDSLGTVFSPQKAFLGYGFACDGPGRGGTCDVSTWYSCALAICLAIP